MNKENCMSYLKDNTVTSTLLEREDEDKIGTMHSELLSYNDDVLVGSSFFKKNDSANSNSYNVLVATSSFNKNFIKLNAGRDGLNCLCFDGVGIKRIPLVPKTFVDRSDTFIEYYEDNDLMTRMKLASREVSSRLRSFGFLERCWDSYEAKEITWDVVAKSIDLFSKILLVKADIPLPFVAPASDGSIVFEWIFSLKEITVTVYDNLPFEYVKIDKSFEDDVVEPFIIEEVDSLVQSIVSDLK